MSMDAKNELVTFDEELDNHNLKCLLLLMGKTLQWRILVNKTFIEQPKLTSAVMKHTCMFHVLYVEILPEESSITPCSSCPEYNHEKTCNKLKLRLFHKLKSQ